MAITNFERVRKGLDLLKTGIGPFIEREVENVYRERAHAEAIKCVGGEPNYAKKRIKDWDSFGLLKLLWTSWNDVFVRTLGKSERALVSELQEVRNSLAHEKPFSTDDTYRALDSIYRLLTAIAAPQATEADKLKNELLRVRFDEQARNERRKGASTPIESAAVASLKPWREVVTPHKDVASGRFQQAEFAADLWQVHLGEGTNEYRDPAEFFRRTYLTEGLKQLLSNAISRLTGKGGDPVVQLQTNFGGGKTHSMLALYHLFSGTDAKKLAGVDAVLTDVGTPKVPAAKRVVLVGNKISPGNPSTKPDGTVVRTLWGELAYQLGGKKAYARVRADDEKATNPGDVLRELFNEAGPCLILIDEWVAYARQLHDQSDLPAGSFETQFSFAQALTESAKLAKQCLLVISLPASDTGGSPHAVIDDSEVGGQRGREALDRLRHVVGRVESSWRPATSEEGFEIVRRRLFEPMTDQAQFVARDTVARAFYDHYRGQQVEFPPECSNAEYERRIKAAYPIHPEIFDRLYNDWSTLIKFQRTRGVLRLMASVIHWLWEHDDRNPLILPSNIPIDDDRVQNELTRYLSDNWPPIIQKDVDGHGSLPLAIDREVPNLGKYAATRRVARTIYLGSAPMTGAANRGLEDRRIKLGCVVPGESAQVFGDALRRLAQSATYLYQDGTRYWYSTQPTVTKLAEDRAEMLKRDPDEVFKELDKRLRADLKNGGDFSRVHPLPKSGQDVPDDPEARLVVLGPDHPHSKNTDSEALRAARAILTTRGNAPRLHQNALVFLAADATRLQDLNEALRRYLAWESIIIEKEELDLSPHQVTQASKQRDAADGAVDARLPETYQWLLVPEQPDARSAVKWDELKVSGQEPLALRASKKVKADEALVLALGGTVLRKHLDGVPLWRGDHVEIRQLAEDFARYLYLPRLRDAGVLYEAIRSGCALLSWMHDSFAIAEGFDEAPGRYRGLRGGELVNVSADIASWLVVKPDVAGKQREADSRAAMERSGGDVLKPEPKPAGKEEGEDRPLRPKVSAIRRYHGSVVLDTERIGRDAGKIAEEVIAHLAGISGADVRVTLEIEADLPNGASDSVVRIVTENGRTLRFGSHGFEKD